MAASPRQTGTDPVDNGPADREISQETARRYWVANLKILAVLLAVWCLVSFGLSIILVDVLNRIEFFGFKLGFWWAQQGSVYVFVGLIFVYIFWIGRVEKRFGVSGDTGNHQCSGRGSDS